MFWILFHKQKCAKNVIFTYLKNQTKFNFWATHLTSLARNSTLAIIRVSPLLTYKLRIHKNTRGLQGSILRCKDYLHSQFTMATADILTVPGQVTLYGRPLPGFCAKLVPQGLFIFYCLNIWNLGSHYAAITLWVLSSVKTDVMENASLLHPGSAGFRTGSQPREISHLCLCSKLILSPFGH